MGVHLGEAVRDGARPTECQHLLLEDMKTVRALSEAVVRVHFILLTESAVQRMFDFAAESPLRPQLYISDRSEADIEVGCH
jgi:hypothetical protein